MSSQHGTPLFGASSTRSILTPKESLHRSSDGTTSGSRKRKRDGNGSTLEDLLTNTFEVKPYPSTTIVKPRVLQPLLLLPRSQLPLSFLDITPFHNGLAQSRLYETDIKILELEERMGSQPVVLIARLDDGKSLYAVEREQRGLYVLLHLGSWVDMQQLKAAAVVSRHESPRASDRPSAMLHDAPILPAEVSKCSKEKSLAIAEIRSMINKRPTISIASDAIRPETQAAEASHELAKDSHPHEKSDANSTPIDVTQPTANEIFDNVRTQYFEALYLSKASLAYFAKGPLSKARAAFHLDYDSTLDMAEHITFLESLVMSTTVLDKRYREGISGCVSSIDILDQSADEAKNDAGKTKKRKTTKKMKLGKNGLYPMEDLLIRRWWAGHDDDADHDGPDTTREDIARARIANLRIRETQLQMIVALEVLALQPLASVGEGTETSLPAALPPIISAGVKGKKTARTKTLDRLSMLIDVHIDRLCIWQTIALETYKAPTNSATSQTDITGKSTSAFISTDNILKDFCVEVILPFFAARLPDRCATINRKLGGPVVSLPKPKLSRAASTSNVLSRPGAATKRPVPAKPRQSLQRVLLDERERRGSHGSDRPITLKRSATAPVIPGLKREASEVTSLGSIPYADAQAVQNAKRFSRREVDMSTFAPKANPKKKTQVNVEAELREAISALKKPNRQLAGKALAETAEKRSASASHLKKSNKTTQKPIQNPSFQGVQISATPKSNRSKDFFREAKSQSTFHVAEETDPTAIPPSSLPRIPQSVTRPSRDEQAKDPLSFIEATPTRKPSSAQSVIRPSRDEQAKDTLSFIEATPTRKSSSNPAQRGNVLLDVAATEVGDCEPISPLQQMSRPRGQLFNLSPGRDSSRTSWPSHAVQETPVKQRPQAVLVNSYPIPTTPVSNKENRGLKGGAGDGVQLSFEKAQDVSIYESLGWDDD